MKIVYSAHGIKFSNGFSLIELLMAMVISGIITYGLLTHYISIKQQQLNVQNNIQHYNDLNWVLALIRDKVHQAGFTPCGNINRLHSVDHATQKSLLDINITQSHVDLYSMSYPLVSVINVIDPMHIEIAKNINFSRQHLIISDCHYAETIEIKELANTAQGQIITLSKVLNYKYSSPIYIGYWTKNTFFLRNSSLYYQYLDHTEELIKFIKALIIQKKIINNHTVLDVELDDGTSKFNIISTVMSL